MKTPEEKAALLAAKLAAKEEAKRIKVEAKLAAKKEKEAAKKAQKLLDCPIPHKNCAEIVELLVLPEYLKNGGFSSWAMELRIFKNIVKKGYKDEAFWRQFSPGFKVKSMLWWFNNGAGDLEKAWRFYQYEKAQNMEREKNLAVNCKISVDSEENCNSMEIVETAVKIRKPKNALEWADQ